MKHLISKIVIVMLLLSATFSFAQKKYEYSTVPNDPYKVRIYKLDNGLMVYLSVYKDAPKIQCNVAVRTGGKNDPADNTGLSHYLEHLMFKGTDKFGTADFAKEEPLLNEIERLFEIHKIEKDTAKRRIIYHQIDSISTVAAKYAVPNEYDKLMSILGATGTNAFTSNDATVYINEIPSNQLENYLEITSERFRKPIFRLFHTELETVYEEKNMYDDQDDSKLWERFDRAMYKKHEYGRSIVGETEHLKSPSIISIKKYFNERYVPNNMAISMSGDFDPDVAIQLIDKYFGSFKTKELKPYVAKVEDDIKSPVTIEVLGPDAEQLMLGFRFPGDKSKEADLLSLTDQILTNGKAGLIDLNLIQAQKVLKASSFAYTRPDYCEHIFSGRPKQGQTLEEVKDLLLAQIELLKKGDFPDWMLPAIINDMKLNQIRALESNWNRAYACVQSFVDESTWADEVNKIDKLSKITKQDIVDFVNKYYNNNYVIAYKRTGVDPVVNKITKPHITPLEINRDKKSDLFSQIEKQKPLPLEPVFLDFAKDVVKFNTKSNIGVLYNKNVENKLFFLYYVFDMGQNHNKKLDMAVNYLKYLGTSKYSPIQIKQEFFKIGCDYGVYAGYDRVYVYLTGLSENIDKGADLFEHLLSDVQPNNEILGNMVSDIKKERTDDKLNKDKILRRMIAYAKYGKLSPLTNLLSDKELNAVKADELTSMIKDLNSYKHQVFYYGPLTQQEITTVIDKYHKTPKVLKDLPAETKFEEKEITKNQVYIADYDMKQVELYMVSKSVPFDKTLLPKVNIFNEYFGNSMASVVFQELREAKGLAYSAWGGYIQPDKKDKAFYIYSFIGTQNDKLAEAMKGMTGLLNNMPESPSNFDIAKTSIINQIRSERITKSDILFTYDYNLKLGIDYDLRKDVFNEVPKMTVADLKGFQEKYIKGKNYTTLVVGKKKDLDMKTLEKYGGVKFLTLEEIFGY
ncbi:MAG: insulinase family protein [Bacteroidota bacterium]